MSIITLTSDFGHKDPDIGHLKGHLLQSVPQANIIDITHKIMPFNKSEAVYVLQNALLGFPEKTIHLVAIESENADNQKPLLFEANKQYFLGNDNGILATALQHLNPKVYSLPFATSERFLQAQIQAVQKLAENNLPSDFAVLTKDFYSLKLSKPSIKHVEDSEKVSTIIPKVIYIDNYGNAIFNLQKADFEKWRNNRKFTISFGPHTIKKLINGYNDFETKKDRLTHAGDYFARFNDFGYLEIFVYQSNKISGGANTLLGLRKHQTVIINF